MPDESRRRADATQCVHAGEERHGTNEPLATPIALTSVFVMPSLEELKRYADGDHRSYMYTRYGNPTTRVAEEKIAALEAAEDCVITASGMAAETATVLAVCESGDEIVSMLDLYGGTTKLFDTVFPRYGVRTRFVPFSDMGNIERHFTPKTRMLFLETPTNPTLRCVDIAALSELAHRHKACVVVDNTFATPLLQKPLALGADVVIHSATKYLGGHNDVTAGAAAGARRWTDPIREMMKFSGGCLDPAASYLLIRGLKTLGVRVERACANAHAVAEFLSHHAKVASVSYPGLPNHPQHELAKRQMKDFGMMVSFELKGGEAEARKFIAGLRLWYLATTLGGVESSVSYPLLSSHVGFTAERLKQLEVTPATIRLSVGIEEAADIVADLEQALDRL